ncbi:MAG TPA: retropepsin-like aspartic protease [Planctomycetota bacterium]|nr:retropepsin-like aspartic protease [Planctomycetota bacterium]
MRKLLIGGLMCALAATSASPQDQTPGRTYPLSFLDSSPYIDLSVPGYQWDVTGTFLFDTGANISGVDGQWLTTSGVVWRSGMPTTVGGTTGNSSVSTAVLESLSLGDGYFVNPSFLVEDFTHFTSPAGKTQVGLLGTDFISCYQVALDYVNGQVTLALANERGPSPRVNPVAVTYPYRLPTVTASVGWTSVPCRIDTGDSYSDSRPLLDVNQAFVDALMVSGTQLRSVGTITVAGVSGQEDLTLLGGYGLTFSIGNATLWDVILVVHDQGTLAQESTPVALAGSSLLARFGRFTLDPFDRLLWIGY